MKKKTVFIIAISLMVVLCLSGVAFALEGNGKTETPAQPSDSLLSVMESDVVISAEEQPENNAETTAVKEEQIVEAAKNIVDEETVSAVSPAPSNPDEDVLEKEYVDNSPEKRVADLKKRVAESAAFAEAINKEKAELEARRKEILESVNGDEKLLSDDEATEVKRIDHRLEEIWLNHSSVTDNPDLYTEEAYFKDLMEYQIIYFCQADLEYHFTPGTFEYWHAEGLIKLAEECLEKYENGENLDDIYLFYFTELDKLDPGVFRDMSGK